jgi:hypothetical protein
MTISPDCRNGCKDFDIVNLCAFRQIQRCRSPITDTPGSATPRRARVTATRAGRRAACGGFLRAAVGAWWAAEPARVHGFVQW